MKTIKAFQLTTTFILLLSLLFSCTPQADITIPLPTGENTMYYYIDGDYYKPKGQFNLMYENYDAITYRKCHDTDATQIITKNLILNFPNGIHQLGEIHLSGFLADTNSCEQQNLAVYSDDEEHWIKYYDIGDTNTYYYSESNSGIINITALSPNHRQFEGTFDLFVYHPNTGKEVHFSKGHFDINVDTLNH